MLIAKEKEIKEMWVELNRSILIIHSHGDRGIRNRYILNYQGNY